MKRSLIILSTERGLQEMSFSAMITIDACNVTDSLWELVTIKEVINNGCKKKKRND